jgi:hypothetical protein
MSKLLLRLPRQSRRKDRTVYEHLFQDGRAFLVTDRVRVLVISLQVDSAEVPNSWKATTQGSRDLLFDG